MTTRSKVRISNFPKTDSDYSIHGKTIFVSYDTFKLMNLLGLFLYFKDKVVY